MAIKWHFKPLPTLSQPQNESSHVAHFAEDHPPTCVVLRDEDALAVAVANAEYEVWGVPDVDGAVRVKLPRFVEWHGAWEDAAFEAKDPVLRSQEVEIMSSSNPLVACLGAIEQPAPWVVMHGQRLMLPSQPQPREAADEHRWRHEQAAIALSAERPAWMRYERQAQRPSTTADGVSVALPIHLHGCWHGCGALEPTATHSACVKS